MVFIGRTYSSVYMKRIIDTWKGVRMAYNAGMWRGVYVACIIGM